MTPRDAAIREACTYLDSLPRLPRYRHLAGQVLQIASFLLLVTATLYLLTL